MDEEPTGKEYMQGIIVTMAADPDANEEKVTIEFRIDREDDNDLWDFFIDKFRDNEKITIQKPV